MKCKSCGAELEACAFCDEPDCPAGSCFRCVNTALRLYGLSHQGEERPDGQLERGDGELTAG